MSFGFAVGDFIAAGKLIASIVSALNSSRGSSAAYQELRRELLSLQQALNHINNLTSPNLQQQPKVYAIKCAALSVQYPLSDFFTKLRKYDSSLGRAAGSGSKVRDVSEKVRWKLGMEEEVKQIRVVLSAHIGTINMMLVSHGLEAMGIEGSKITGRHKEMCEKMESSSTAIAYMAESVEAQGRANAESREVLGQLEGRVGGEVIPRLAALEEAAERDEKVHTELHDRLEASHTAIVEVSSKLESHGQVGEENKSMLKRLLQTITGEVIPQLVSLVETVGEILKSNIQIYNLALKGQAELLRPDLRFTWAQDPCRLEDALGRVIVVPSEYEYSKLEAIIKDQFKVGPGKRQVMDGNYEIFNSKNSKELITESEWTSLLPGMWITMAIIVESASYEEQCCPLCQSEASKKAFGGGNICSKCGVWFEQTMKKRKRAVQVEEVEAACQALPTKRPMLDHPPSAAFESLEQFKNVRVDISPDGMEPIPKRRRGLLLNTDETEILKAHNSWAQFNDAILAAATEQRIGMEARA
ncbi:hypothetical protein GP486_004875 [Trichoglossum hirsutum]|uniref:Ubiquitin-like domain-containing protein n=1 Tax=Trichoglossum hirsutum TaxID=265104 RepID=A0A9P8RNV5_9PEZI|nr:hypothetical protein GP486_004875 [Trichoglossum hirsutum]